ncbi:Acetyltransferase (GNAT) domain-containing protein [Bosea sp. OK403]|nr:Acetyltransferase (GNAT) domain-containing protein [Bosea sp. OK403]
MICRNATARDLAWLTEVALDNYRAVFAPLLPECDWSPFDEAHFRARFSEAWPRIRIVADAVPLGFALVTDGHIDMFFVDRSAQGRGVGASLLGEAQERGACSLETFAVNQVARRFYERAGWRIAARYSRPFAGAECDFLRYERS